MPDLASPEALPTRTERRARRFLQIFDRMEQCYKSDASWEVRYEIVRNLANEIRELGADFSPEYYDPDTSYEEDTTACYNAFAELAAEYRKAFAVTN